MISQLQIHHDIFFSFLCNVFLLSIFEQMSPFDPPYKVAIWICRINLPYRLAIYTRE